MGAAAGGAPGTAIRPAGGDAAGGKAIEGGAAGIGKTTCARPGFGRQSSTLVQIGMSRIRGALDVSQYVIMLDSACGVHVGPVQSGRDRWPRDQITCPLIRRP